LVVDEVHASDPYMTALTRGLIERHLSLGGHALAMSATLGEAPYPAIRNSSGDRALPKGQAGAAHCP
jgi:CRISPR-associated endonuclease/helicase Cas3